MPAVHGFPNLSALVLSRRLFELKWPDHHVARGQRYNPLFGNSADGLGAGDQWAFARRAVPRPSAREWDMGQSKADSPAGGAWSGR